MSDDHQWSRPRRVTLDDVARQAGVSRAMVSVVLRGQSGASATTREKVLAAAEQLGYRPDLRAQSLAGTSSRLIGVIFGAAGTFHFDLLEGLYDEAEKRGYSLILGALTRERDERRVLHSVHGFALDGMVMLGPATPLPLSAGALPLVVIGWDVDHPMVDVVRTSDHDGVALAVEHLVQLGHRRIAHLDGGPGLIAAARRDAYVAAMTASGLSDEVRIVPGGETTLAGVAAAQNLLRADAPLPTALVAYNDDTAVGALSVFREHGIDVPGVLSVIGYDDSEAARDLPIGLTSVAQHPHVMARHAVQRVVARARGTRVNGRSVVLDPELVVRSSTAPPG